MVLPCRTAVLEGDVAEGREWRQEIGEGWIFRVIPIAGVAPKGSPAAGQGYSGWDLAMDRKDGGGYPDGLLLGTPPYGSLSEREIGTTYGMRAQDAIAWNPRRFHFLLDLSRVKRARELYATVMAGKGSPEESVAAATRELLEMVQPGAGGGSGSGEFRVLDARLVPGLSDPPVFARQWAANLGRVPHTLEELGKTPAGAGEPAGRLRWIRFRATITVPGGWKLPAKLPTVNANCAE